MVPGWNSGPLKQLLFVAVMTKTTYRRKSLFHLRVLEGCSLMVEKDGSGCLEQEAERPVHRQAALRTDWKLGVAGKACLPVTVFFSRAPPPNVS